MTGALGATRYASFNFTYSKRRSSLQGWMSALRYLYRKVLKRRDIANDDLVFPKVARKRRSC
jgi:hypothetical protein